MHTSSPKHTYSTRMYIVTLFLCACVLSCYTHGQLFATLWTVTHQAPLSTGFSRQEYRSGLPCPSPGDCPNPGIEPMSPEAPALQEGSLPLSHWGSPTLFVRTQRKIQMLVNNKTDTIVEYSYWGVLYNKKKKKNYNYMQQVSQTLCWAKEVNTIQIIWTLSFICSSKHTYKDGAGLWCQKSG